MNSDKVVFGASMVSGNRVYCVCEPLREEAWSVVSQESGQPQGAGTECAVVCEVKLCSGQRRQDGDTSATACCQMTIPALRFRSSPGAHRQAQRLGNRHATAFLGAGALIMKHRDDLLAGQTKKQG